MAAAASSIPKPLIAEDNTCPKWKLAREGIQLIINNRSDEAEALFKKYPDNLQMFAGYSFATFMDALMTFEEDKLNLATSILKEIEGRCGAEGGWFKSMKSKMFGSEHGLSAAEHLERQIILADSLVCLSLLTFLQQDLSGYFKGGWILRKSWKIYQHAYNEIRNLHKEIVGELPDSVVYKVQTPAGIEAPDLDAASTSDNDWEFDEPAFSSTSPSNGYIKDPYSPKISHSYTTHFDEKQNLSKCNCKSPCSNVSNNNSLTSCNSNCNNSTKRNSFSRVNSLLKKSKSVSSALSNHTEKKSNGLFSQLSPFNSNLSLSYFTSSFNIFSSEKQNCQTIDKETISRLMSAISFGYGLFHLGISLLPPSLLRITHFLGFGGNRQVGLSNLMYARLGTDMRAPLATLSLLWYHTIVRPFYALDGSNVQAGVEAASQLLLESDTEYKNSGLFLFFKGRVHRLNSNIFGALQAFQASVDHATQREIKVLSLHEVGWCYLIQLEYPAAEHSFQLLKLSSRWSRPFYAYLAMICSGSSNNLKDFSNLRDLKSLVETNSKGSQLEIFLLRRFQCCPQGEDEILKIDIKFWKLLLYELLYLWNTLPSCSGENITNIIKDCALVMEQGMEEPMLGLSKLIEGSCFCILKQYENGIGSFRECLKMREGKDGAAEDAHISAFAQYELGMLLIKKPESKEEGKSLLIQMTRYKDYDFEQRLTVRIHAILKKD